MKTKYACCLVLLVLLACGPGLSCSGSAPASYWVVLYAFSTEGELLHSQLAAAEDTTWAGRRISVGYLEGIPVVLASSGIGTTNAAITLQYLLDHYAVQGVLFTGICGGIARRNRIGDIVIPDRWVTHDYGYVGAEGFQVDSIGYGHLGEEKMKKNLMLPVDSTLHDRVCRAANVAAVDFKPIIDRAVQVRCGGVGATGNQFIDQVEKRQWLAQTFDAEITDMESAAVLQTALANGVPCVIIRSASDLAGGSGSATAETELKEFFQIAADNSAAVVSKYFRMLYQRKFEIPDSSGINN